jgi:hypothetical protein
MRAFSCPTCGQLVYFENTLCLRCGSELGFDPEVGAVVRRGTGTSRSCANVVLAACNWLVRADDPHDRCRSCRITWTRPDLSDPEAAAAFVATERAKRRLVFQLLDLGLPVVGRDDDPEGGVAFQMLSSRYEAVTTGHADGVITIDLAEGDDAHRERTRQELGEPYRTLLGHLRHEIGHHYWVVLVDRAGRHDEFRALFGDERADYRAALDRHYATGPARGWEEHFVSAYATAHPWEDWAETFAHYLHVRDTLQTAAAYGVIVTGPVTGNRREVDADLIAAPASAAAEQDLEAILGDWFPLTYALNALNRSMGRDDLYPFVLSPPAIAKLAFVHDLVRHGAAPT